MTAQPGKIVYSKTHRLIRDRESLLLTLIPSKNDKIYEIKEDEEVVMLPIGTFHFEEVDEISEATDKTVFIDRAKLKYPFDCKEMGNRGLLLSFWNARKKETEQIF